MFGVGFGSDYVSEIVTGCCECGDEPCASTGGGVYLD